MAADNQEGRYEAVECTSSVEIVLWANGDARSMLGFVRRAEAGGMESVIAMHRADALALAAAEVAEREKMTFAFYADEMLRANRWPNHCNDPEEAGEQLAKVGETLAVSLRHEDPFRAAVEFEQRMGTTCDVRLVRLFENTLPWVAEAAAAPSTLDRAAAEREGLFLARSPMAKALKRSMPRAPSSEPPVRRP